MTKKAAIQKTEVPPIQMSEGLKSLYLELENFKNIDKKIIDIGGKSIMIMGKNGTGKSTLIQAMKSPMDAKIVPSEPIKKGEERARITHKIGGQMNGEYKEYTMDLYFTPGNKSGRLVLTNEKGEAMKSPATMIKTIIGNVSFDITSWMNAKKEQKLTILKNLTGKGVEIDTCNMTIKNLKAERKMKNDRAEELEGALKNHGFSQEEITLYSTPKDMTALNNEMASVADAQAGWDNINNQIEGFYNAIPIEQNKIQRANNEISRINMEIARLKEALSEQDALIQFSSIEISRLESNILEGEKWRNAPGNVRPSVVEIAEKIRVATEHNQNNQRIGVLGLQQQEIIKLKGEVDGYKLKIETEENKRNDLIAKSQLPINGLSFDDEQVYLDGVPLEEGQQNTALLFDVGVEVAMALNPNLKIIFLDDASLYDKAHLSAIVHKIEERGYMAVCEVVAESDDVEVKFTEEAI